MRCGWGILMIRSVATACVLAIVLVGCRERARTPDKPRPPDPEQLALLLHRDLTQLGDIATRWRGNCPELVAALRPHVARMRQHFDEVTKLASDAELAAKLRIAVAAYDDRTRGLADSIGDALAASYRTCTNRDELRALIDQIPQV